MICGQSWVLQRVNKLENAEAAALESLALGKKLPWPRNTAFCLKCLGRLCRLQAEAADDAPTRERYLARSEGYLVDAIAQFESLADSDRHAEIGDCQSLLGRTLLVANRLKDAQVAARTAESLLSVSDGKDYQDLQILHGDLIAPHDVHAADGFYTTVIQQCANNDARYSEVRARAYSARARSRLTHGRKLHAKRDFEAAADIWKYLQDPAVRDAEWGVLSCSTQPSLKPTLLESRSRSSAVRVRAVRIHEQRMQSVRGKAARRTAEVSDLYLERLICEAKNEDAIDELEWVSRVTQKGVV